jgi:MerR family transcriptional regulator, thiopeptide resistance regulator
MADDLGMTNQPTTIAARTVGQVAEEFGVTVRTLHHYDDIGLLSPSDRSASGYRLYTEADLERLRHVVVYRRLALALDELRQIIDAPAATVIEHLQRQRDVVGQRIDELHELTVAIDAAIIKETTGMKLTKLEQTELFGDHFSDEYAAEAEQRWGDTDAWKQSQQRTARYTKQNWVEVQYVRDAIHANADRHAAVP